jgi:hypothetical protein
LILNTKPFIEAEIVTPLRVDFAVKVKIAPLEGEVTRGYEEGKTYPKEEGVQGEEWPVVKEDSGPAHERGDYTKACSDSGHDELGAIAYPDNVGMFPNVKPSTKHEYDASEGISRELKVEPKKEISKWRTRLRER